MSVAVARETYLKTMRDAQRRVEYLAVLNRLFSLQPRLQQASAPSSFVTTVSSML